MNERIPRSRPRRGEEHEMSIDRLAYGGAGIGRLPGEGGKPGMAVFVLGGAPGDRLRVRLDTVHRRHAEATLLDVLEPGADRVDPVCPHYEEGCGGCSWQHLSYAAQLSAKEDMVRDSLERIGGFRDLVIAPILGAEDPWYYRNKMEFAFHARDGLGLHVGGDWRHVVPIHECRLQSELAMRIVAWTRDFVATHELTSWDPVAHEGYLRELVIRQGRGTGETMVGLVTSPGELRMAPEFAEGVAALDASIVSVVQAFRSDGPQGAGIESVAVLRGRESIRERVDGLTFELGLQTFFQTNTGQAALMLAIVRRMVEEGLARTGDAPSRLLDVFCGVGFFALELADLVSEVVGVDVVEPSIQAARDNAERNGIANATFYAGDARRTLPEVIERHGAPGIVILDPPRSGAGGKVMRRIARAAPTRIVYVSCNPTTLARDLQELEPFGYRIAEVQPIDLFPQTYHVETIVAVDLTGEPTEVVEDDETDAGPEPDDAGEA